MTSARKKRSRGLPARSLSLPTRKAVQLSREKERGGEGPCLYLPNRLFWPERPVLEKKERGNPPPFPERGKEGRIQRGTDRESALCPYPEKGGACTRTWPGGDRECFLGKGGLLQIRFREKVSLLLRKKKKGKKGDKLSADIKKKVA